MDKALKISFLVILISTFNVSAQQEWSIGGFVSGTHAYQYNVDDWNADPSIFVIQHDELFRPKSLEVGFNINYHFNNYLSIEGQLIFSNQQNSYKNRLDPNTGTQTLFEASVQSSHVKIPILAQINTDIENGNIFYFGLGPIISFSTGYNQYHKHYLDNYLSDERVENNHGVNTSNLNIGTDTTKIVKYNSDNIYSSVNFGFKGQLGIRFQLGEKLFLNFGIHSDYMITNAENLNANIIITEAPNTDVIGQEFSYYYPEDSPLKFNRSSGGSRKPVHLFTYGFTFGFGVYLNR